MAKRNQTEGARRLSQWMGAQGISAKEMSEKLGVAQSVLSRFVCGRRQLPRTVVPKASELTGIPARELAWPRQRRWFPKEV